MRDPQPLSQLVEGLLQRMGIGDLRSWRDLRSSWREIAGPPWDRAARPVVLRDGVLVVEAVSPAAISLLRYGVGGLQSALDRHLGAGVVREIRIRAPGRGREG